MVESERQVAGREPTTDVRYYIGSKPGKARAYAGYIRGHWGIENALHWVLGMVFDEDRSRIRRDHGQENLALLRRLAVSVLKNAKSCPCSIRTKQLQAILDDEILHDMLSIFSGG
jgi:predicted transposase YbfD/YdcC